MTSWNMSQILINKRREKGLTQEKAAHYFGVSKASVSKWETGRSFPDVLLLPQIAAFYNITMDELFGYSPQLTSVAIKEMYASFGARYLLEDHAPLIHEIEQMIRKYFSCPPFILAMAQWFLNYGYLSEETEQKDAMILKAQELAGRVTECSNDPFQLNVANGMLAQISLFKKEYELCFEILGEEAKITTDTMCNDLLAKVYLVQGNAAKAAQINQINIFQSLSDLLNSLVSYQSLNLADKVKHDTIYHQVNALIDNFHLEKNCSNALFLTHILAAQAEILHDDFDAAVNRLRNYCQIIKKVRFPLLLNDNDYFDLINEWIEEKIYMGNIAPTTEDQIKTSFLKAVKENQLFSVLTERADYKEIIRDLTVYLTSGE